MEEEGFKASITHLDSLGSVHGSITSLKSLVQPPAQPKEAPGVAAKKKKVVTVIKKSPDYPRIKFNDYIPR